MNPIFLLVSLVPFVFLAGCSNPDNDTGIRIVPGLDSADSGNVDTADSGDVPVACEAGTRPGAAGSTDGLETPDGYTYNVRAPDDYDPTVARPLIMVYAPAGADEESTEQFTRLTNDALAAGYVIAYADHHSPTSERVIDKLAAIPGDVEANWCIDPDRVYLTGHSDGGSTTSVIAVWELLDPAPAAVAPSAAGVDQGWVESYGCPASLPVMVMHSSGDTLFPESKGFGEAVAEWWADCDGCDPTPGKAMDDGCLPYQGCSDGTEVLFCEGSNEHGVWPHLNDSIIEFFDRHPATGR